MPRTMKLIIIDILIMWAAIMLAATMLDVGYCAGFGDGVGKDWRWRPMDCRVSESGIWVPVEYFGGR